MRKLFYSFLSLFLLFGCIPTNNKTTHTEPKKPNIQLFLDSCLESNPNARNNEVTRGILADTIKTRLQTHIGDTLAILSDTPLEYEMCLEYSKKSDKNKGRYVVKFSLSSFDEGSPQSDKFETTLQVFTIMEKQDVAKLTERGKYQVQGVFVDFANYSSFILPSGRCFTDYPSVTLSSSYNEKLFINLGTLILDSVTVKPITRQQVKADF